jgi:hypothetical protein
MYQGTLIYTEPFLAWRNTNLVCGYDSSIRHMRTASACVRQVHTRTVTPSIPVLTNHLIPRITNPGRIGSRIPAYYKYTVAGRQRDC